MKKTYILTGTKTIQAENEEVEEACPHCEVPLEPRMHDSDGTNLIESNTCPECGYGTPALL